MPPTPRTHPSSETRVHPDTSPRKTRSPSPTPYSPFSDLIGPTSPSLESTGSPTDSTLGNGRALVHLVESASSIRLAWPPPHISVDRRNVELFEMSRALREPRNQDQMERMHGGGELSSNVSYMDQSGVYFGGASPSYEPMTPKPARRSMAEWDELFGDRDGIGDENSPSTASSPFTGPDSPTHPDAMLSPVELPQSVMRVWADMETPPSDREESFSEPPVLAFGFPSPRRSHGVKKFFIAPESPFDKTPTPSPKRSRPDSPMIQNRPVLASLSPERGSPLRYGLPTSSTFEYRAAQDCFKSPHQFAAAVRRGGQQEEEGDPFYASTPFKGKVSGRRCRAETVGDFRRVEIATEGNFADIDSPEYRDYHVSQRAKAVPLSLHEQVAVKFVARQRQENLAPTVEPATARAPMLTVRLIPPSPAVERSVRRTRLNTVFGLSPGSSSRSDSLSRSESSGSRLLDSSHSRVREPSRSRADPCAETSRSGASSTRSISRGRQPASSKNTKTISKATIDRLHSGQSSRTRGGQLEDASSRSTTSSSHSRGATKASTSLNSRTTKPAQQTRLAPSRSRSAISTQRTNLRPGSSTINPAPRSRSTAPTPSFARPTASTLSRTSNPKPTNNPTSSNKSQTLPLRQFTSIAPTPQPAPNRTTNLFRLTAPTVASAARANPGPSTATSTISASLPISGGVARSSRAVPAHTREAHTSLPSSREDAWKRRISAIHEALGVIERYAHLRAHVEEIKSIREAARTVEDEITGGPGVEAGKEWRVMMAHLESVQGRLRGLRARIDVLVWVADGEEGERELAVWVERIGGLAV